MGNGKRRGHFPNLKQRHDLLVKRLSQELRNPKEGPQVSYGEVARPLGLVERGERDSRFSSVLPEHGIQRGTERESQRGNRRRCVRERQREDLEEGPAQGQLRLPRKKEERRVDLRCHFGCGVGMRCHNGE